MRQWSCTGGDIQYGQQVSGGAALVQRHEHMLDTVPGELGSDVEWGIGARTLLGRSTASVDTESLGATYRAQHLRDPETLEAAPVVNYDGKTLRYKATLTPREGLEEELEVILE